jgi:hypothetical protein
MNESLQAFCAFGFKIHYANGLVIQVCTFRMKDESTIPSNLKSVKRDS